MSDEELARFLERTALDPELCALARRDLDAAAEGFGLHPADREVLRAGDGRVLDLLGRALRASGRLSGAMLAAPAAPAPVALPRVPARGTARAADQAGGSVPLPPVALLLSLAPDATPGADGSLEVSYTANLQPAPDPGAPPALPPREAPAAGAMPLPTIALRVEVAPWLSGTGPEVRIGATGSVRALGGAPPLAQRSPWGHRLDAPEALRAAAAVRAAPAEERYARLLELVAAIQPEDRAT